MVIIVIDRTLRTTVDRYWLELPREPDVEPDLERERAPAREVLGRAPDVDDGDLVSWGRVRPAEVAGLIDRLAGDARATARRDWDERLAAQAHRDLLLTVVSRRE